MKTDASLLEFFEEWLLHQDKSPNTINTYKSAIQKLSHWLNENKRNIVNLTHSDIQEYMNELERAGKSAATIDKIYATIRVFAQFLDHPGIVNNIRRKEKEKNIYQTVPEFLNEAEKSKLLHDIEKDNDLRNTAIVYMLLYTGIRLSELCNLDRHNIEIYASNGTVTVQNPHGDRERTVPIPYVALQILLSYLKTLPEGYEGPLFISKQNNRLTTRSIQYMLEKYNISPHKLRHTFCRDLIQQGIDLTDVAQLAGHNDINITKRYLIKGA